MLIKEYLSHMLVYNNLWYANVLSLMVSLYVCVCVCMCVRVCVCVTTPSLLITSGMMWCDIDLI